MNAGENVGYIRVSTTDQNTARQLADIQLDRIFTDTCSGKNTERPEFQKCMIYLRRNDTLHVHSIDRLARNLQDLLQITTDLTKRGVKVVFHKENLIFDGSETPMQTAYFHILGAIAQMERGILLDRQREGIKIARANGKYKGRQPKLTPRQVREIRELHAAKYSTRKIAKKFHISRGTVNNALGIGRSDCYAYVD